MTRYKIVVIDLDDEARTRVRKATFKGTEDDVEAVWDEVENALHLVRAFGRKQGTSKELLEGFTAKGKLRDLK